MKSRAELLREAADQPERLVEYIATLQAQLSQAQALIAELKRELFGAKADKLSPEQEEQLRDYLSRHRVSWPLRNRPRPMPGGSPCLAAATWPCLGDLEHMHHRLSGS